MVLANSPEPEDFIPEETTNEFGNLAAATATNRATLAALTSTNGHLTKQLTEVTNNLTKALDKIQRLYNTVKNDPLYQLNPPTFDPKVLCQYCWSHGFRIVARKHNSQTYKASKDGHKKEDTAINKMGGSEVELNDVLNK